LASNQTFTGNPDYLRKEVERYSAVTTKDVMRVFEKYIKGKKAVILSVYPKGKSENVAAPDNAKRPSWPQGFKNNLSEYESLKYIKAPQGFDRSKKPAAGKNPVINVPQFWNTTLANGIQIIGSGYNEVPTTDIQISIPAGQFMETTDKNGVAQLTAALLNESTNKRTAEEISAALESLGSSIRISADKEEMNISVSALNKNLDKTLLILEEILFAPKFSAEEFNRLKTEQLQSIKNQQTNANAIAGNIFRKVMYPAGSIQSMPESGTDASVNALTVEDVKKFYDTWFAPDFAKIVIVGNISKAELESKLGFLNKWNKKNVKLPAFVSAKGPEKTTIYFANKDNAPQSQILLGEAGLRYDGLGAYYQCGIMNYVLGGAFNSRINLNLREKHGYTYGARMGFNGTDYVNLYSGGAGVKAEATDSSIIEFMNEIKGYLKSGITASELEFTKNSIGQRDALKFETPGQKAGFMKSIMENKYDKDLVTKQNNILSKITSTEINALASKYIHPDKMAVVVVGDRKRVFEKLKALGYDIIEMDAYGNPLK
jgi:zinc protease